MGNMALALGQQPPPSQQQSQQQQQQQQQQLKQGKGNNTLIPTHTSHILTTTILEAFSKSFRGFCFPIIRIPLVTRSTDTMPKKSTKNGVTLGLCFVLQQLHRCTKLLRNLDLFVVAIMSAEGLTSVGRLVWDWLIIDVRPALVPVLSWVVMGNGNNEQETDKNGEEDYGCVVVSAVLNFLLVLVAMQKQGLGPGQGLGDRAAMAYTMKANTLRSTLNDIRASLTAGGGGGGTASVGTSTAKTRPDSRIWVTVSRADKIRVGNALLTALQAL